MPLSLPLNCNTWPTCMAGPFLIHCLVQPKTRLRVLRCPLSVLRLSPLLRPKPSCRLPTPICASSSRSCANAKHKGLSGRRSERHPSLPRWLNCHLYLKPTLQLLLLVPVFQFLRRVPPNALLLLLARSRSSLRTARTLECLTHQRPHQLDGLSTHPWTELRLWARPDCASNHRSPGTDGCHVAVSRSFALISQASSPPKNGFRGLSLSRSATVV